MLNNNTLISWLSQEEVERTDVASFVANKAAKWASTVWVTQCMLKDTWGYTQSFSVASKVGVLSRRVADNSSLGENRLFFMESQTISIISHGDQNRCSKQSMTTALWQERARKIDLNLKMHHKEIYLRANDYSADWVEGVLSDWIRLRNITCIIIYLQNKHCAELKTWNQQLRP